MANRWALTDEIREKFIPIIRSFLHKMENMTEEELSSQPCNDMGLFDYCSIDLSDMGINPYQLRELLQKEFPYDYLDMDRNGWEMDFWIYMRRNDGKHFPSGCEKLVISGCGMTHKLTLNVED